MKLQIRNITDSNHLIPLVAYPRELYNNEELYVEGLPTLCGKLGIPAPRPLIVLLQIHNGAGIPIIKGQGWVEAGQQHFTISELRPLGLEAYGHKREIERAEVAQRIWSRRAYATLTIQLMP